MSWNWNKEDLATVLTDTLMQLRLTPAEELQFYGCTNTAELEQFLRSLKRPCRTCGAMRSLTNKDTCEEQLRKELASA